MNITLPRAVIEQTLDALEAMNPYPASKEDQRNKAITALRTALGQPEQELVCVCGAIWEGQELVSAPPQRKPLTDEEIWNLAANCLDSVAGRLQFARAIEAAHNIKD